MNPYSDNTSTISDKDAAEKCRECEPKREPRRDRLERAGIDRADMLYRRRENLKPQLRK